MNQYKSIIAAIAAVALASCADDKFQEFRTAAPERDANYAYLNEYGDLKSYVDRAKYPRFVLGGATSAGDFNKQELVYALDVANFDELLTGNDFKYASVVSDDGVMNFSTIESFCTNATDAGLGIYGHTLVWHSQQRPKYLTGLMADRPLPPAPDGPQEVSLIKNGDAEGDDASTSFNDCEIRDGVGYEGSRAYVVETPGAHNNSWDKQLFIKSNTTLSAGDKVILRMKARAERAASIETQAQTTPGNYLYWQMFGNINITTEWKDYTFTVDLSSSHEGMQTVAFNLCVIDEDNTFYFDDVEFVRVEEPQQTVSLWINQVNNPDCETDDASSLVGRDGDGNGDHTTFVEGAGIDGSRAVKVHAIDNAPQEYTTQFFVYTPGHTWQAGEKYHFKMWARADKAASIGSQAHTTPGNYIHWSMLGNLNITTEWKEFSFEGTITADQAGANGMQTIAFNLNVLREENNYYFDNIEWSVEQQANGIPLTEEEKRDTIQWAMEQWISGMMEACNGRVKAWDLVNEPMSDASPFELKSGDREGGADNFYWQDYLGKDYARIAARLARQYGGDDLILFVNDYNLEAAYNQNRKCDGLIQMIEYWESDGVTKIDGIGSQMHVTYSLDAATQERNEAAVVTMLEKLAATGKLIRISELDMGIADENGNSIKTVDVTEEQHRAMADYYKFIIRKYLEIIPADQQYGITAWGITDSPDTDNSYWRRGEPIGLWDLNYYRKHTYAGFADGLSGK